MKKNFLFLGLLLLVSIRTQAQDIPEPEFSNRPYFLKDSILISFERVDASAKAKVKALGYGGSETFLTVEGLKSSTRFVSKSLPRIFIKFEENLDPADRVSVMVAELKGSDRRFKTMKMGGIYSYKIENVTDNKVLVTYKRIRANIFEVIFPDIPRGEYAFLSSGEYTTNAAMPQIKLNCFGVD